MWPLRELRRLWTRLQGTFWFVPSLIVAASIALAVVLVGLDFTGRPAWIDRWPRVFGAGAAGARGMLSTIAGSMMTVVGVTFSMTLVTLVLASSQYTSRILRNFMRDRVTQIVLGIFAGLFTYCLIVLRTIRGGDENGFIPSVAVTCGVVLAIGGISVLIFFIHHIASSIQASNIIASVAAETMAAIDDLFPERLGPDPADEAPDPPPEPPRQWRAVSGERMGYVQSVDGGVLRRVAQGANTIVRMECGVGEFVVAGASLVSIAGDRPLDEKSLLDLRAAFRIDRYRTVEQDVAFGIRQIVDMALRALSPGVNDSTTAVMCLDYLTAVLCRVASRRIPSTHHLVDGELRVIARGPTFASLSAEAFDQIRGSATGNVAVLLRMLDSLETIAGTVVRPFERCTLRGHVESVAELAARSIEAPDDRLRFDIRLARVRERLRDGP